ncbi:MAG: type I restriction enzyme HsdR N-terminal domain-containing protein [Desulfatitalea sp.]|nr:type I restriction enzyme HsdR N-terminal domain-containing protein [Desulfatitalea sp.]
MNDHHLILGRLTDLITGRTIDDTHDERYRQLMARLLVYQKGYRRSEITPQQPIEVRVDGKCARVPATYIITIGGRAALLIHYGPGSLVTRHRPALAMSRLAAGHQIPVVVVTNGETADILDGATGQVTAHGLEAIPARLRLQELLSDQPLKTVDPHRAEREARILMAFEVDDRCPCDDTVCTWKDKR